MIPTTRRTHRRSLAVVAVLSAAALTLSACGGDDGDGGSGGGTAAEGSGEDLNLITDGTLVVAMSGEFQPFSYFDGNTLTGFDYDIGAAMADQLGLELKAETGAFDTLIQGVKADRYDVLVASMTPTPERAEQVDFTDSYYVSGAQAFVAPDTECTDITKMDKPSVGVATGTTYQDWLKENGDDWLGEVRTYSSDITALQDTAAGRLDAAMTDRNVGLYQIQQSGLDLVECGEPVFTEEPAFAVKKGNTALKDALNEGLATIKEDGTYAEISTKYFGKDISSTGDSDDAATTSGSDDAAMTSEG